MTAQSERIIATLSEHNGVLVPAIQALMAQAWEEGTAAGLSWDYNREAGFATPNPYAV